MQSTLRSIVVVGSLNMDLVSRVPYIPRVGQTIFGSGFQTHPGGKGANQAVAVARLGYPVAMIGMLGKDAFGRQLREQLEKEGVNTEHVGEATAETGTATILVDDAGQNCIVVTPGANAMLTPEILQQKKDVLGAAGMVLAQLEIPMETIVCLAEMCASLKVPLILDPAPATALPEALIKAVTWFTPNETEAEFYSNNAASEGEVIQRLQRLGVRGLVLKRGAEGCLLVDADGVQHRVASPRVQAVDTTAAGDAFNAAFAVALMQGQNPEQSAAYAATAAAISVTRAGAQPSLATADEVKAMLSQSQAGF
jgi:ribokinase